MDSVVEEIRQRRVWVNGPIIVGGGPSGLATAACLKEKGMPCIILEKADCIASLWQQRSYDRLKLHLPKQFCELPLMPFPKEVPTYPTKNQFVQYLESYALHFNLAPRFNERVESACYDRIDRMWRVRTGNSADGKPGEETEYIGKWLIVATGENAEPIIPDIQGMETFGGQIIHSSNYRCGAGFEGQNVLVVGCANSGMEVALDLANYGARPSMVVRSSVHVLPREICGLSTFGIAIWLMRWLPVWLVDWLLLCVAWLMLGNTHRYGIRRPSMGPLELKNKAGKTPVLDVGTMAKIRDGQIKVMPGLDCLTSNGARFVNGQEVAFDSVILATGYKSNVPSWLKNCSFFSEEGIPNTPFPNGWKGDNRLYAVGFTKRGLMGASMDAMRIAEDLGMQWKKLTKQFSLCKREMPSDDEDLWKVQREKAHVQITYELL